MTVQDKVFESAILIWCR